MKYNNFMTTKLLITNLEFTKTKRLWENDLLRRRRSVLIQWYDMDMTQQEIADYWGVDISLVNRIIKKHEAESVAA